MNHLAADRSAFFRELERSNRATSEYKSTPLVPASVVQTRTQLLYADALRRRRAAERPEQDTPSMTRRQVPRMSACSHSNTLHQRAKASHKAQALRSSQQLLQDEALQDSSRSHSRHTSAQNQDVFVRLTTQSKRYPPHENKQETPCAQPKINAKSRAIASRLGRTFEARQQVRSHLQLAKTNKTTVMNNLMPGTNGSKCLSVSETNQLIGRLARPRLREESPHKMRDATFAPRIDTRSRLLAPQGSGGIDELHENRKGKQKYGQLVESVRCTEMRECTFAPQTNRNHPPKTVSRNPEKRVHVPTECLESEECTFQPITNTSYCKEKMHQSALKDQVKGTEHFLERRQCAMDLLEERKARQWRSL